ncbi:MAG: glycosyltransferase family 2 protein, partial [Lachnospiraceae bacterium]|nr:glycosyltransferase family 2 protein [Lachnospiraceae bacterium]
MKNKMKNKPKVSVIIATHNNAATIENCIESLWSRNFSDIEVIAVDVNSTDGTKDILSEMAANDDQIIFLADSLGSMGHARNMGMSHARAPYIIFADPDGFFSKDAIEYMYLELEGSPDSDMFTCETDCFGSGSYGRTFGDRKKSIEYANYKDTRKQEMDSRLIRSWMFENITIYRASFLQGKGIRHYEKPGYGSQDSAFRFLAMASGISSMSVDVKYRRRMNLTEYQIKEPIAVKDVCDEFRFLKEQLKKDPQLWWKMRLVYWQAYYDRNMQLYEGLSDDLRARLSKKLQADIKEAIIKKEFSRDHFDIRVRDEMELLMKSADEFDRYQSEKIGKRKRK